MGFYLLISIFVLFSCSTVEKSEKKSGGLKPEEVQTVIRSKISEITPCFREHTSGEAYYGQLLVRFVIDANGRIKQSEIKRDAMLIPKLSTCVLREIATWEFPKPRNAVDVTVTYPFNYRQGNNQYEVNLWKTLKSVWPRHDICPSEQRPETNTVIRIKVRSTGQIDSVSFLEKEKEKDRPCLAGEIMKLVIPPFNVETTDQNVTQHFHLGRLKGPKIDSEAHELVGGFLLRRDEI